MYQQILNLITFQDIEDTSLLEIGLGVKYKQ